MSKRAGPSTDGPAQHKRSRVAQPSADLPKDPEEDSNNRFRQVETEFLRKNNSTWRIYEEEQLPGAQFYYLPNLIDEATALKWYDELCNLETWYRPTLKVYGKQIVQSRAIAAYAMTPDLQHKYSGQVVQMHHPYPPLLQEIQVAVEQALGFTKEEFPAFNHVMLNRYDDGSVHIGNHSDNKENQVIASLSLGAPRTFIMSPRKGRPGKKAKWVLANGSLVIMQGQTQDNWKFILKHEIPKEARVKDGRISLTFRQLQF